jgi:uncharacterized protein (DUF362 family)
MSQNLSRRNLFRLAAGAAGAAATARILPAQETAKAAGTVDFPTVFPNDKRSLVALMQGEDRRKNVYNALVAIDKEIQPVLKTKKYVLIKPNNVSTENQLAATHADALRGILDYLDGRFKGPVVIAESSAGNTMTGFENFKYTQLPGEYKRQQVKLVDFNEEAKYRVTHLITPALHVTPVRLAARLFDPEAFIVSSAMLKTHNTVVVTQSVKNMVLGAPLHQAPKETPRWNDKRKYHGGVRQTHYNMLLTAMKLQPFWGAAVVDGFEGMEGNGPGSGTPVASRVAIASRDFIAADRVGVEAMGVDPSWPGYLNYCGQVALGQYDLKKIDIEGANLASVVKKYRLHKDLERELQWMGPMTDVPPPLG